MEFERENPQCKFTVPDRPTVRQQLQYYSLAAGAVGREMLLRYWEGAKALVQSWECELIPKLDTLDLDALDNPKQTDVIIWAGLQVRNYMNTLDEVPKNS